MAKESTPRIFRASNSAESGLIVTEHLTSMVGDKRHSIIVDNRGVTLKGPLSLMTTSENIRRAGFWIGGNDFLRMIPSTLVTPQPMNWPMPPIHGLVALSKDLAFFASLLG